VLVTVYKHSALSANFHNDIVVEMQALNKKDPIIPLVLCACMVFEVSKSEDFPNYDMQSHFEDLLYRAEMPIEIAEAINTGCDIVATFMLGRSHPKNWEYPHLDEKRKQRAKDSLAEIEKAIYYDPGKKRLPATTF
jgi:hypothetical protein